MARKNRPTPALVEQLRAAIQASGHNLNQISLASGVHRGQLARFMDGMRDLTLASAGQVCAALGITLDIPASPRELVHVADETAQLDGDAEDESLPSTKKPKARRKK